MIFLGTQTAFKWTAKDPAQAATWTMTMTMIPMIYLNRSRLLPLSQVHIAQQLNVIHISRIDDHFKPYVFILLLYSADRTVSIRIRNGIHFGCHCFVDIETVQAIAELSLCDARAVQREEGIEARERFWSRSPYRRRPYMGSVAVFAANSRVNLLFCTPARVHSNSHFTDNRVEHTHKTLHPHHFPTCTDCCVSHVRFSPSHTFAHLSSA